MQATIDLLKVVALGEERVRLDRQLLRQRQDPRLLRTDPLSTELGHYTALDAVSQRAPVHLGLRLQHNHRCAGSLQLQGAGQARESSTHRGHVERLQRLQG